MPEITKEKEERELFKVNGRILRPCIVLFNYQPYLMIDPKTGKKQTRSIWDVGKATAFIGMQKSAKIYGSMLGLPAKYEDKELSTGKIIKVESRVNATPFQQLSWKLSMGLDVAGNNMNLSIRPKDVEELVRKAIKDGKCQDTGVSYLFFMCRTNDLRREMTPTNKDKWLIFPAQQAITKRILTIDEALRRSGSKWRLKQTVTVEDIIKALKT